MHYFIIAQALGEMALNRPRRKFLEELLPTWLSVRGRFNFKNLSRYIPLHERTLRRGFGRGFSWLELNSRLLAKLLPKDHEVIAALDASFVPKSGKKTFGLGSFYNGCAGRTQKGLEVSVVSVVDLDENTAYALSARQTPPGEPRGRAGDTLKGQKTKVKKVKKVKEVTGQETRIDAYLKHFQAVVPYLPSAVHHLAVDGAFAVRKFVSGVRAVGLHVVGKLRHDADLRYLYKGPQPGRGRPRLYDGKVQWSKLDLRRWKSEGELEPGVRIYSASLYHVSLKCVIQVVLLQETKTGKLRRCLLFSTDLELSARDIVRYYRARFQIEFLFRDAKQFTGLNDCQARNDKALHFHWNAALCAVNLAKWETSRTTPDHSYSVASCKQRHSNERLLKVFTQRLDLNWTAIKSHPAFHDLCNYGAIHT